MRRSRVVALLAAGGFAVAGCSAPGPAEVTFYADGHTINTTPVLTCDYSQKLAQPCSAKGTTQTLKVRPQPGRALRLLQKTRRARTVFRGGLLSSKPRKKPC